MHFSIFVFPLEQIVFSFHFIEFTLSRDFDDSSISFISMTCPDLETTHGKKLFNELAHRVR